MQVEWYGQSAFRLQAGEQVVAIDPFGEMAGLAERGMRFDYPPITGLEADPLLVRRLRRLRAARQRQRSARRLGFEL